MSFDQKVEEFRKLRLSQAANLPETSPAQCVRPLWVLSTVGADSWSVYRRYRKFRELHKTMRKNYYEVGSLDFPNRRFFGNRAEEFVRARRAQLETYLQSFIGLCSKIPDCPISSMTGRPLTKRDLCDFAPFFKQGIFEQTKHYSG
ncbi:kinesin-like protein KIF16B [Orbicella faveolata]|uniref:kinesin-like protein KIF16B n=1 Tax=Orbicella faveolata TaxID=48498 RepID=UPI0009E29DE6|nr:kinesin-like protein KIF16B [Orbicella faveolata]